MKQELRPKSERAVEFERREMNFKEKLFYPAIWEGFKVTTKHLVENIFGRKHTVTLEYPDVQRPYPERFRGQHRLMQRDDGTPRCVACMCCSTACPSNCITIVAGERPEETIEKFPVRFEIDLLKCIYCGMCVEACPCDAIRMDSGVHPKPTYTRKAAIVDKEALLSAGEKTIATQGGTFGSRVAGHLKKHL